jgi:2-polyprenyl-3-methyl-5-hydroxy-6-metoxy-1,4-benzoquinol methylase
MERIPTAEELQAHYASYEYGNEGYLSPITIGSYNILLDEFENYRRTGRLLDVGCGRGWFLTEAKKRGWEVYGTEYSETAVKICEASGIAMRAGKLDPAAFAGITFDVITSFEVIEHINNPNEELQNIHTLLRTGGLFYCTTPNFNSLLRYYLRAGYNVIEYPEHLSYYTKKTLNYVAKKNGFRVLKVLSTGISITRLKVSLNRSDEKNVSAVSADEKLRQNISSKRYLRVAKKMINGLLTLTGSGMTLKGYYLKK